MKVIGWGLIGLAVVVHFSLCYWDLEHYWSRDWNRESQIIAFVCARDGFDYVAGREFSYAYDPGHLTYRCNTVLAGLLGIVLPGLMIVGGVTLAVFGHRCPTQFPSATSPLSRANRGPPAEATLPVDRWLNSVHGASPPVTPVSVMPSPPPIDPATNPRLFPCPDCGRYVSRLASSCPQCGRPLTPNPA